MFSMNIFLYIIIIIIYNYIKQKYFSSMIQLGSLHRGVISDRPRKTSFQD